MSAEPRAEASAADVEQAFADLLCEDPEFVDAEFEAIIAANGLEGAPPAPARPEREDAGGWPIAGARYAERVPALAPAPAAGTHMPGRQRSPPRRP